MNIFLFGQKIFRNFSLAIVFLTFQLLPLFGWSIILITKSTPHFSQPAVSVNDQQKKDKCYILYLKRGDSLKVSSYKNYKGMLEYVPCQSSKDSAITISFAELLAVRDSNGKIIFSNDSERFPGGKTNFYTMGLTSGILGLASIPLLFLAPPVGVILASIAGLSALVLGTMAKKKMKNHDQKKGIAWARLGITIGILWLVAGLLALLGAGIEFG
jgi:hypothetical protein